MVRINILAWIVCIIGMFKSDYWVLFYVPFVWCSGYLAWQVAKWIREGY